MGSVWRAEHMQMKTPLAIKLMDPAILTHPEGLARFEREAQAAASLRSPNVVQVFDYGIDENIPYLAMELLEGGNALPSLGAAGQPPAVEQVAAPSAPRAAAPARARPVRKPPSNTPRARRVTRRKPGAAPPAPPRPPAAEKRPVDLGF
jgi:hypothetical protein